MIRIARARTALAATLLGTALALPLAQGAAPQAAHAASGPTPALASLLGTWHNADPTTRSVRVIRVTYDAFWHWDNVQTWARCHPEDCYWGTQTISPTATSPLAACYDFDFFSLRQCVILQRQGDHLAVTLQTNDNRHWGAGSQTFAHFTFIPGE